VLRLSWYLFGVILIAFEAFIGFVGESAYTHPAGGAASNLWAAVSPASTSPFSGRAGRIHLR
jgi:hypothetical protein